MNKMEDANYDKSRCVRLTSLVSFALLPREWNVLNFKFIYLYHLFHAFWECLKFLFPIKSFTSTQSSTCHNRLTGIKNKSLPTSGNRI